MFGGMRIVVLLIVLGGRIRGSGRSPRIAAAVMAGLAWTILATWRDTMGVFEGYVYLLVVAALIVTATYHSARAAALGVEAAGVVLV